VKRVKRGGDPKSGPGGMLSKEPDVPPPESLLGAVRPLIGAPVTNAQHAVDQPGETVSHRGDGFGRPNRALAAGRPPPPGRWSLKPELCC